MQRHPPPSGVLGLSVLVAVLALGGCDADPAPTPNNTAGSTSAGAVAVGDCFADPPRPSADLAPTSCADASFEVVAIESLDGLGDDWPGLRRLSTRALDVCSASLERYLGGPVATTGLDVWFHHPDEDGWRDGSRRVVCAATTPASDPLGGSVEGRAAGS